MKRRFSASVWREGDWYVAQCLDVDVASQGETEEEALANLREALELHFEPPVATITPQVRTIEVETGAAWAAPVSGSQAQAGGCGLLGSQSEGRSHVKFAKITAQGTLTANVPRHREVAVGTLRSIIR